MMRNIKILVPANLAFSAGIREISQEAANSAGFQDKQKNMLRLIIDEIFMNAVKYGSDNTSSVFLEFVIEENKLTCGIEDEGKGTIKLSAEELRNTMQRERENSELQKTHGRGLAQITSELVSAFEVSDRQNGGLRIEFIMEKNDNVEEFKPKISKLKSERRILPEKTIKISGIIDLNNIDGVKEKVEGIFSEHINEAFRLIFDFTELKYFNSSFLALLANWQSILEKTKGECIIKNPTDEVFEILDLVGLTNIFIIENTNKNKKEESFIDESLLASTSDSEPLNK